MFSVMRISRLVFLTVAMLVAMPASFAQTPALTATFVSPGKTGEVYWDMVSDSMHAAGARLGIRVETLRAERNSRRMRELGLEVVARQTRPDFLILVNEEAAAVPVLEAADKAGIKTFLLSSALTGADAARLGQPRQHLPNWIGSLVPDMEEAGARMARSLIAAARAKNLQASDNKIHILAIGGDETTPVSVARNLGMEQAVAEAGDVVVERMLFANWNADEAEALTRNFLKYAQRKNLRVAGIWAANDPMALGALKAASEFDYVAGSDIFIAGLNWSAAALEKVEAGQLLLTDGGHFLLGTWSMVLLRDFADGCDFARTSTTQLFRTSAVTSANAATMRDFVSQRRFDQLDVQSLRAVRPDRCGKYDFSAGAILNALAVKTGG